MRIISKDFFINLMLSALIGAVVGIVIFAVSDYSDAAWSTILYSAGIGICVGTISDVACIYACYRKSYNLRVMVGIVTLGNTVFIFLPELLKYMFKKTPMDFSIIITAWITAQILANTFAYTSSVKAGVLNSKLLDKKKALIKNQ